MQITTTVVVEQGESFAYTADAAAAQVLAALGGNPTTDRSTVTVSLHDTGQAGASVETIPPPDQIQ
jgi:hypothetical protein